MARVSDLKSCLMWETNRPYYSAERQSPYFRLFGQEWRLILTLTFHNSSECYCYVRLCPRSGKKMSETGVLATCHIIAGRLGFGGSERVAVGNSGDVILKCIMSFRDLDSHLVGAQNWKIYCHFSCDVEPHVESHINNEIILLPTGPSPSASRPECPDVESHQVSPEPAERRQETEKFSFERKLSCQKCLNLARSAANVELKSDAERENSFKELSQSREVSCQHVCLNLARSAANVELKSDAEQENLFKDELSQSREVSSHLCLNFSRSAANVESKPDAERENLFKEVNQSQKVSGHECLNFSRSAANVESKPDAERENLFKELNRSREVSNHECLNFSRSAANVESKPDAGREHLYEDLIQSREVSVHECSNFAKSAANVESKPDAERENLYKELCRNVRKLSFHLSSSVPIPI